MPYQIGVDSEGYWGLREIEPLDLTCERGNGIACAMSVKERRGA